MLSSPATDPASSGRPPEDGDAALSPSAAEEEQEISLYLHILEQARDEDAPMAALYAEADRLTRPWAFAEGAPCAPQASFAVPDRSFLASCDREGNPNWISLAPSHRPDDPNRLQPESVLPGETEKAGPPSATWEKRDTDKNASPDKREPAFISAFRRLFEALLGREQPKDRAAAARREHEGKGSLEPRRPRPLRSLFRMALLGAVLACIYTLLGRLGVVPPLL